MALFVAISYCEDQDQVFHDVVEARMEKTARELAEYVRGDYAVITDIMPLADFQEMARAMSDYTGADIISRHTKKQFKEEYA